MSEHEHSQEPDEREETVEDLEVPEEQADDVEGGAQIPLKRGIDN